MAAPVIDAVTSNFSIDATNTFSHTVSGADRLLLVSVIAADTAGISGVAYNAVPMTRVAEIDSYGRQIELWKLVAPASGAHNVVVTMASGQESVATAASFTGVDQSVPLGTAVADAFVDQPGTSHSHATDSQVDALVWDSFLRGSAQDVVVDGGQTQEALTVGDSIKLIVTSKPGATPNVTTGYSFTNEFSVWAHITASINAPAAARRWILGTH